MSLQCRVQVLQEVTEAVNAFNNGWILCLQWCRYLYSDNSIQNGFRFIWRRPNGNLQAARGQARIDSLSRARNLMDQATAKGWGNNVAEESKVTS